jgi:small subunit ribosomal protein S7
MARRYRPEKREIEPDLRYNNLYVAMFVNRLMYDGKKSVALTQLYNSFDLIEERAGRPGVEVFEQALQNVSPQVEVKPRRVGGATYQVPVPVEPYRQLSLAMRWVLQAARNRGGNTWLKNWPPSLWTRPTIRERPSRDGMTPTGWPKPTAPFPISGHARLWLNIRWNESEISALSPTSTPARRRPPSASCTIPA